MICTGHLSVSSDNILLYRYAFWVLDRYIILSFDMYHVSIVHMYVRRLLSDDESVVSVTRREQQLEQTCLTICFLLLFCFVVDLFCFYLCLFVQDSSWSIIIYFYCFSFWPLHCLSFDLRLQMLRVWNLLYSQQVTKYDY